MQRVDGTLIFSPSDLQKFVDCEHLTRLQIRVCNGELTAPTRDDEELELLRRKGMDHERAWLERVRSEGKSIVEIPERNDWSAAADATEAAMRSGVDVIYQAVFQDDSWRGIADFLVRVPQLTALGPWGYEAWDTKLARRGKPSYVLQLAFYCEQIERVQRMPPELMHVVLGTNEEQPYRPRDFAAYFRRLKQRLRAFSTSGAPTYPYPVSHCSLCDFENVCDEGWDAIDHLSRVASIRREQAEKLEAFGILTLAALGAAQAPLPVKIGAATLVSLIGQARLQNEGRVTGTHSYELLPPEQERGFGLLPEPDPGDLFFDIEGYPHFEPRAGLEYLFGIVDLERGTPQFRAFWGKDRQAEKAMFEDFIDVVRERLARRPNLHIYHYAAYEPTKLKELMQRHGTREEEVDDLLRRQVFVDLFRVVRQTMRTSHDGYSLKQVRTFFMKGAGEGAVTGGGQSILEFARWLDTKDGAILEAIERYNEEDCHSTLQLREWLLDRKREAEQQFQKGIPWRPQPAEAATPIKKPVDVHANVRGRLLRKLSGEADADSADLLSNLLGYHSREAKPAWWAYYDRLQASSEELLQNTEAIARLSPVESRPPRKDKQSAIHALSFPEQEYKLAVGHDVTDPRTGKSAGVIVTLDGPAGILELKRGPSLVEEPLPTAIISGKPLPTDTQAGAVARYMEDVAANGLHGSGFRSISALIQRAEPRFKSRAPGAIQTLDLAEQEALVTDLDGSCLFIQGPPGSGKTWTGARLIVSLLAKGYRIGVAAQSHKAIHNLLEEVERVAIERGVNFQGLKKGNSPESQFDGKFIHSTNSNQECESGTAQLVAGTSWLFARDGMQQSLDYLFIDEAGQTSLGDAVAMGTSARNFVLLGDPQQLANVSQGVHAAGSGLSVLEHLLRDAATVGERNGLFLARSWRMHPDVCRFVSELSYDGRLESAPDRQRQRIESSGLNGTGLRYIPVVHSGNAQRSAEEALVIVEEVARLLADGRYVDCDGVAHPLEPRDILVVAPYNMQVRCLLEHLPAGVEAGTVDKFQGREAPIVFFSLATSSGENVPRDLTFLFSRNRLNVAVSRAKALAILVASPRLLEVSCRTVEQMRLVNGWCRFVELAGDVASLAKSD